MTCADHYKCRTCENYFHFKEFPQFVWGQGNRRRECKRCRNGMPVKFKNPNRAERTCLNCETVFMSESKKNRICDQCKSDAEVKHWTNHGTEYGVAFFETAQ